MGTGKGGELLRYIPSNSSVSDVLMAFFLFMQTPFFLTKAQIVGGPGTCNSGGGGKGEIQGVAEAWAALSIGDVGE